jgi:DNA integrity scanning protein DisA with diadenylate cyclase activity
MQDRMLKCFQVPISCYQFLQPLKTLDIILMMDKINLEVIKVFLFTKVVTVAIKVGINHIYKIMALKLVKIFNN